MDILDALSQDSPAYVPPPPSAQTLQREVVIQRNGEARQAGTTDPNGRLLKLVKKRSEVDLHFFCKAVLGLTRLTNHLHKDVCEFIQRIPPYRKLIMLPRDCFKSTIVAKALPLHKFIQPKESNLYWPGHDGLECKILLSCETEHHASKHIQWIQQHYERNALLRALWPDKCWEAPRRQARKWNSSMFFLPRELSFEQSDPTMQGIGVGGAITGGHFTDLINDDLISLEARGSESVMETAKEWQRVSRPLMEDLDTSQEYTIGCLPADSEILLADGTRKCINNMTVGEEVWACDTDGFPKRRRVKAVIDQGLSKTLTVKTSSKTLRATPNHPFLVRRKRALEWVRADELKVGDYVIGIKNASGTLDHKWMNEDFCWLFGFLLGDGWTDKHEDSSRGYVCIAKGVDEALNKKVISLAEEWLNGTFYEVPMGFYRLDSKAASSGLKKLGFRGTAKTKRLPAWTFKLPDTLRRSLLRGFCDADGAAMGNGSFDSYRVEISNKGLMEDLRHLASICGVRTGILGHRKRINQPPNSPKPVVSECWSSSFNFATVRRCEVYHGSHQFEVSGNIRQERIMEIVENPDKERVYDLSIHDTPAFFANGLAVHNTHWATNDLYAEMEENDPTVSVYKRSLIENGKNIFPEEFSQQAVDNLRKSLGSLFSLLYLNNPRDAGLTDFRESDLRFYQEIGNDLVFEDDERDRDMLQLMLGETSKEEAPGKPQYVQYKSWADVPFKRDEYMTMKFT